MSRVYSSRVINPTTTATTSLSSFLTRLGDHDVVVVAISDPQNVGGHAVAAAGVQEPLHRLLELEADAIRGEGSAFPHT